MRSGIPANHPLRRLFTGVVENEFRGEHEVAAYIANLMAEFAHVDSLYKIRDARGKHIEEVGQMMIESNPLLGASSFDREREVRKHIGDYTLFLTGLFPEYVASLPRRGLRLDSMIDYVKAGKESYRIVAAFDHFEYRTVAPLFRKLSNEFEGCVYRLNRVRQRLDALRAEPYQAWQRRLWGPRSS